MQKKFLALLMAFGLVAAACGSDTVTEAAADVADEAAEVLDGEEEAMEDEEEAMEDDEEAMEDEEEAMEDDEEAMEDEDAMEDVIHDLNLVQNADLGQILTDVDGNTVYIFTNDEQGADASACEGDCIAAWPVVGELTSPAGALDASLVSSFERADGTVQATYNGWPLYNFASDEAPGDTNGQGVNGIWWVLDAEGNPVAS